MERCAKRMQDLDASTETSSTGTSGLERKSLYSFDIICSRLAISIFLINMYISPSKVYTG